MQPAEINFAASRAIGACLGKPAKIRMRRCMNVAWVIANVSYPFNVKRPVKDFVSYSEKPDAKFGTRDLVSL